VNEQKQSQLSPWEPYRLFSYFIFTTWFGAGILLGANWKRLGKPEWMWKTILLSILIPAITIAGAIGWTLALIESNLPEQLVMSVPFLAMSINFGYLWSLARLQNGAYKKFKTEGPGILTEYSYDIDGAMFFGGIVVIVMTIAMIIVIPLIG